MSRVSSRYAACLFRIRRIVAQQMRVFLDRRAAARRVHHDRFHAFFDIRPPRVDVGAQVVERLVVVAQVQTDRTATAGFGRD